MTLVGPDVASFQEGLDLTKLSDASYFLVKATEGDSYTDPYYAQWAKQAKSTGKPLIWYHFIKTDASARAQAAHVRATVDPTLPGMIDFEPTTASVPTFPQLLDLIDEMIAIGLKPRLAYIPRWYWSQIGGPDLTGLARRGVVVVSSSYPGSVGTGPEQYAADGGDFGPGWAPYGGVTPAFWQYTDTVSEQGKTVDYSAYRGSAAELAQLLGQPVSIGTTTGQQQLSLGSAGQAVRDLQGLLNVHGGFNLIVDGAFGPQTDQAVRAYQYAHALEVDGVVGTFTWSALNLGKAGLPYPGAQQEQGSSGTYVREIQQELAYRGIPVMLDAVFGPLTRAAVVSFQSLTGLLKDGVVGPVTWGALFH